MVKFDTLTQGLNLTFLIIVYLISLKEKTLTVLQPPLMKSNACLKGKTIKCCQFAKPLD